MKTFNTTAALSMIAILCSRPVHAQVTIQPNDLYAIGSRYQVGIDDTPGATPGNSGINLSWTFTGFTADDSRIVEIMAPADSPFGTALPGDRALVENTDQAAEHLTVSTSQLLSYGRVFQEDGLTASVALNPPMVLLNLPAQYYQTHQGVSRSRNTSYLGLDIGLGFVVDSIRLRTQLAYQSEVGGWGSVSTPLGTFGAIKQSLLINVTDSVDIYRADQDLWINGIDVTSSVERSWAWWTPEHDMPVVQLFDEENDGTIDRAEWIEADLNTTGTDEMDMNSSLKVFPNPATDRVTVELHAHGQATYALHDMNGRLAQQGLLLADRNSIPLTEMEQGVYQLRVEQGGVIEQARLIVQ
jgi:hypothetical protein